MKTRPFIPTPKVKSYQGRSVLEVDCRRWETIMRRIGQPLRRRYELADRNEADRYCSDLIVQNATGLRSAPEAAEVRQLFDHFLDGVKAERSIHTAHSYGTALRRFTSFLDELGISSTADVSPGLVQRYRAHLFRDVSPGSANVYMVALHRAFSWAEGEYLSFNPVKGLVPKVQKNRRRSLTDDERAAVLECSSAKKDWWLLMLMTGLRGVEVRRLSVEDVVLQSPAPHLVVDGKGHRERIVPLVGEAISVAQRLVDGAEGGVLFPFCGSTLRKWWVAERKRLKLSREVTLHCFRHDFATFLCNETQMPNTEVRDVMGHSSLRITERYMHPDRRQLKAGMELRSAQIGINAVSMEAPERKLRVTEGT